MNRKIFAILVSIITIVTIVISLFTRYPKVDYLPSKYSLKKINTISLFTQKLFTYEINKTISIDEIKNYPRSKELIQNKKYQLIKWHLITENEKNEVLNYINNYLLINNKRKKIELLPLINSLKKNKNQFFIAKIGLYYGCCSKRKIDLSYFFLIDNTEQKLYSFKLMPNM